MTPSIVSLFPFPFRTVFPFHGRISACLAEHVNRFHLFTHRWFLIGANLAKLLGETNSRSIKRQYESQVENRHLSCAYALDLCRYMQWLAIQRLWSLHCQHMPPFTVLFIAGTWTKPNRPWFSHPQSGVFILAMSQIIANYRLAIESEVDRGNLCLSSCFMATPANWTSNIFESEIKLCIQIWNDSASMDKTMHRRTAQTISIIR